MRINSGLTSLLLVLAALAAACSRGVTTAAQIDATTLGRSFERESRALGDTTIVRPGVGARLDSALTRASAFGFSGVALIADSTRILLHRGYGFAKRHPDALLTPASVWDIGSITKGFTGLALAQLEKEGKVRISDSLRRYFPDAPPDKANITLHQVLTHTSGLIENSAGDYDAVGRDSAIRIMFSSPLVVRPGTTFSYSNAGFSLASAIIEKVTGLGWEEYMRTQVFEPAGMRFTGYHNPGWDRTVMTHTFLPGVEFGPAIDRIDSTGGPYWNLMGNAGSSPRVVSSIASSVRCAVVFHSRARFSVARCLRTYSTIRVR